MRHAQERVWKPPTGLLRAAGVALALFPAAGCGLFYKNSHRGPSYTLYSDRSEEYLTHVAEKVDRIYAGYSRLFELSSRDLGRTAIVLDGSDSDVVDYGYSPSILGYYVPLLNYICVDTAPVWTRSEEMLEQVLLHEIAHHFVVTEFPGASSECWLNEGLAGALEVTVFDDAGFEHPLVNPILCQVAQRAALTSEDDLDLEEILNMSWGDFHTPERKERNYALSWSIVYFLLEHYLPRELPLGRRIDSLYSMDRKAIARLQPLWIAFLKRFDLTGHMLELALQTSPERRLTALWATRQLGSLRALDELRMLHGLLTLFDDADRRKSEVAYVSFLEKLARVSHSYLLSEELVLHGVERIGGILGDPSQPTVLRQALTAALESSFNTREHWLPRLVWLLDGGEAELRAAAARTLSKIGSKPTIVNPDFWRSAPDAERRREVAEWEAWLAHEVFGSGDGSRLQE